MSKIKPTKKGPKRRVLTFSRYFPAYHGLKGQSTHFVEKIHVGLNYFGPGQMVQELNPLASQFELMEFLKSLIATNPALVIKHHTIREGTRWKAGDIIRPRVWSALPYRSKQITFAPDLKVQKVWSFRMIPYPKTGVVAFYIGKKLVAEYCQNKSMTGRHTLEVLAANDGLSFPDLLAWFKVSKLKKPFYGQIICWNKNINY